MYVPKLQRVHFVWGKIKCKEYLEKEFIFFFEQLVVFGENVCAVEPNVQRKHERRIFFEMNSDERKRKHILFLFSGFHAG